MATEIQRADLPELRDVLADFFNFLTQYSPQAHFLRNIKQMLRSTNHCIQNEHLSLEEYTHHLLHDWNTANHAQTGIPSWAVWSDDPQKRMHLNAQFQQKVMNIERFF